MKCVLVKWQVVAVGEVRGSDYLDYREQRLQVGTQFYSCII